MENASDALIMAGNVLIFIITLSICISSYTTLRVSADSVISQRETINLAKDPTTDMYINYIESRNDGSARIVGAETVVSSMYRAIKENYVLYIKLNKSKTIPAGLVDDPKSALDNGNPLKIVYASQDLYLNGKLITKNDPIIKVTIASDATQKSNASLAKGLYNLIKGEKFSEYLGEWQNNSVVNTEDKITNRIITYIQN